MPQQAFEYLDKACLAAASAEHGCNNAPCWQLDLQGHPPVDALVQALLWLLHTRPTLGAKAVPLDGPPDTAVRWAWQWPDVYVAQDAAALVRWHDFGDKPAADLASLRQTLCDRFLDLTVEPGFAADLVWLPQGRSVLFVQHHHALADGRAMIELFADLFGLLDVALRGGQPTAAQLAVVPRRPELAVAGIGRWDLWRLVLGGLREYLGGIWRTLRQPLTVLFQNESLDYRGSNGTLYLMPTPADWERYTAAAKTSGANLTAYVCAGLLLAQQRWHAEQGSRQQRPVRRLVVSLIAETRPRDGSQQSFANHLSWPVLDVDLSRFAAIGPLAAELHRQAKAQMGRRAHLRRYVIERAVALATPLPALRKMLFASPHTVVNLNYSNVLAMPIPAFQAGTGTSAAVSLVAGNVAAPTTPRTALCMTLMASPAGKTINLNYKASVLTAEEVDRVGEYLLAELG
jgi:hypothetical protein